jgi:hypothetical protein
LLERFVKHADDDERIAAALHDRRTLGSSDSARL